VTIVTIDWSMKIFTLFALVLCLGISNGFGKVWPGLKVNGDFRNILLVVEHIAPNDLVTHKDIENTVKLRLFSNNIKTIDWRTDYLYVNVSVLPISNSNVVYNIKVEFNKRSKFYGVSESVAGSTFAPSQGAYGSIGSCYSKDTLLSSVKGAIDRFLVDYIESNMED
jgi:hypothetical protein